MELGRQLLIKRLEHMLAPDGWSWESLRPLLDQVLQKLGPATETAVARHSTDWRDLTCKVITRDDPQGDAGPSLCWLAMLRCGLQEGSGPLPWAFTGLEPLGEVLRFVPREIFVEGFFDIGAFESHPAVRHQDEMLDLQDQVYRATRIALEEILEVLRMSPAEAPGRTVAAENNSADLRMSEEGRSVYWCGRRFTFTPNQAACICHLYREWCNGTPEVSSAKLLTAAGVESSQRIHDVFKKHPAWGTLIVPGDGRGMHRLAPPPPPTPIPPKSPSKSPR